jgi:hypothetical protein
MLALGQVRGIDSSQSVAHEDPSHCGPVWPAAEVDDQAAPGVGARFAVELGVVFRVIGPFVMGQMEVAEPRKGQGNGN